MVKAWREQETAFLTEKKKILCVCDSNVAADNFFAMLMKAQVENCLRFRSVHEEPSTRISMNAERRFEQSEKSKSSESAQRHCFEVSFLISKCHFFGTTSKKKRQNNIKIKIAKKIKNETSKK